MKKQLEAAGYEVDLQCAANDIATQVSQIENMIANGCECLVIASIDGEALGTVLDQAKAANIPVIAYDRLIMNSDAVSYYAAFDNWKVGVKQGEYIVEALDLANAGDKTYNIEYITGDPGDNNINFFFDGAISVLQPYIDAGTLWFVPPARPRSRPSPPPTGLPTPRRLVLRPSWAPTTPLISWPANPIPNR